MIENVEFARANYVRSDIRGPHWLLCARFQGIQRVCRVPNGLHNRIGGCSSQHKRRCFSAWTNISRGKPQASASLSKQGSLQCNEPQTPAQPVSSIIQYPEGHSCKGKYYFYNLLTPYSISYEPTCSTPVPISQGASAAGRTIVLIHVDVSLIEYITYATVLPLY